MIGSFKSDRLFFLAVMEGKYSPKWQANEGKRIELKKKKNLPCMANYGKLWHPLILCKDIFDSHKLGARLTIGSD